MDYILITSIPIIPSIPTIPTIPHKSNACIIKDSLYSFMIILMRFVSISSNDVIDSHLSTCKQILILFNAIIPISDSFDTHLMKKLLSFISSLTFQPPFNTVLSTTVQQLDYDTYNKDRIIELYEQLILLLINNVYAGIDDRGDNDNIYINMLANVGVTNIRTEYNVILNFILSSLPINNIITDAINRTTSGSISIEIDEIMRP